MRTSAAERQDWHFVAIKTLPVEHAALWNMRVERLRGIGNSSAMSTATLSSAGQVTIPNQFREALHLLPGDRVLLTLEGGKLVLEPDTNERAALVEEDGRIVLVAPPGSPPMTAEAVKALLSDIP